MTLYGHECGKPETAKSTGNVVHSISGSGGGIGAHIIPDRSSSSQMSTCFQATGFKAYKNTQTGAHYNGSGPKKAIFSKFTMIDNNLGFGMSCADGTDEAIFEDSKIFGASPSPDCPQDGQGGYCDKSRRCGFLSSIFVASTMEHHPIDPPMKPHYKSMGEGAWSGVTKLYRNEFINW